MENKNIVLPAVEKEAVALCHFPTRMQTFIFRNWLTVAKERIAAVLDTDVKTVEAEAKRMGLGQQGDTKLWAEKGYITIIRDNWHLLNYPQLMKLLDWSEERLATTLKEEDFLDYKMGMFKPDVAPLTYAPLTDEQLEKTKKVAETVAKYISPYKEERAPFDFFSETEAEKPLRKEAFDGAVVIDNGWCVKDNTNSPLAAKMIERFKKHIKNDWDISFDGCGEKAIEIEIISGKEDEYHELEISENKVVIKGGSPAGVLRGLYRIESIFAANFGPYLEAGSFKRSPRFKIRYIYPYCGLYNTAFDVDSRIYCPDVLLEKYARIGINGIWLHTPLYQVSPFPFDMSLSAGYEARRKVLKELIDRAAEYGIKIYLYINEPRAMPLSFYEKYPDMKGAVRGNYACMCTSVQSTKDYLREAITDLCKAEPGIGGFFTITISENDTHCKSVEHDEQCPRCAGRKTSELVAEVNTIVCEAAKSVDENISVIAWDWGWIEDSEIYPEDAKACISSLPKGVAIMSTREELVKFERGGIENRVRDYSLSVSGLSERSSTNWKTAHDTGHATCVKMQINNTWECSSVPYLPVFDKIKEHMNTVCEAKVDNLMLSWSLGGYPSASISFISEYFFEENGELAPDLDFAIKSLYGKDAPAVKEASKHFSHAFEHFPFDIKTAYLAPQNAGVSNPLFPVPTGLEATMTCYSYDDLESWRSIYPVDIFENQFKMLCDEWEKGLDALKGVNNDIKDVAYASYSLFKSTLNQIRFVRLRDEYLKEKTNELAGKIREVIKDELELTHNVYKIMLRMPEIGFEAANHYYYSRANVAEKIINCTYLLDYYK